MSSMGRNHRILPRIKICRWRPCPLVLALLVACGDDGGGESDGTTGTSDTGDTQVTSTGPEPTHGTTDAPVVGDKFGLLNFTYYPATAAGLPEALGMAGAWRTEPFATDDFFAAQAWSLSLPPAPTTPDTIENQAIPPPYDWGLPDTWVTAGNALKLRGDQESIACLLSVQDAYPVYLSDDAAFFDPACAPDPARWVAGADYDLIAFGGELAEDVVLPARVTAPPALALTGPDISASLFPLDRAAGLALAWEPGDDPDARVVVRLIDTFGQTLSAHALDDGAFTIPAEDLADLAPGPATLTVARERLFDVGTPVGVLRVILRYEIWADPDLL